MTSVVTVLAVDFTDTSGSPFATQIDNITDAGSASGFPDNTFKPQDNVKRQQFAYWMDNCGSRTAVDDGTLLPGGDVLGGMPLPVQDAILLTGGAEGQHQYLMVLASMNVGESASGSECPCSFHAELALENVDTMAAVGDGVAVAPVVGVGGNLVQGTATVFQHFVVDTATTYRGRLVGWVSSQTAGGCGVGCLPVQRAEVMMWTAPFNETGGAGPS